VKERATVRVTIRVRPGASRTAVGGDHDGALVVAVGERAVDGRATEAVLRAVAEALGVRRRQVSLITGATSRTKVIAIDTDSASEQVVTAAVERLRGRSADPAQG
jgi:uncharacterized protein YggU (UPF0235/DUF167 family)